MLTDTYPKRIHLLRSTMAGWDLTSSSLAGLAEVRAYSVWT